MDYNVGDIVRTKKPHPCGSKLWEITRVGVDFKLKCQGCGHIVVLERPKALKMITKKMWKMDRSLPRGRRRFTTGTELMVKNNEF